MEKTYKYRFSRRRSTGRWSIWWSSYCWAGCCTTSTKEATSRPGSPRSSWRSSTLMSLSIPRRIVVTDEKVEVRCLLDIREIRRDEIASVRRVDPRRMKWFFPVFGGCGFFGYYGHFLDLRRFERVKLYASEWKNFVEITDIYERPPVRLVFGCRPPRGGAYAPRRQPPGGRRRRGRAGAIVSGWTKKVDRRRPGIAYFRKMILYLQPRRNG